MAKKNPVQFQAGMSLPAFLSLYGTEHQCRKALADHRWHSGFRCERCGHAGYCHLKCRDVFQCNRCKHQVSLTSGTIFADTKLPLRIWFLAIYLLTQNKNGISALSLRRQLGVSYNTAWLVKHKLMQVMAEREQDRSLGGFIQVDDAYWGGERHGGGTGRGSPGKTPFVVALACSEQGRPLTLRMDLVAGFRKAEISKWARRYLQPESIVVSDGLSCFITLVDAQCTHIALPTGSVPPSLGHPVFLWLNTILGNVKNALHGTYHALKPKYLRRYLAEFCYRFNRRFQLHAFVPRFLHAAARTPPLPYRLATVDA